MSQDPMKVPCDEVITRLWEYIDHALAAEPGVENGICAHLEACSHCFPQYDFQRAYVTFIRRTRCEDVPAALRRRIFEMILEEEGKREGSA